MSYTTLMYSAVVPAANVNSMVVPKSGRLLSVDWHLLVASAGADFVAYAELAFVPSVSGTINGADQLISMVLNQQEFTTSGVIQEALNYHHNLDKGVVVQQGEKLYINASGTAVTQTIRVLLMFDFTLGR